jgi:Tol biopolymer transport system component
MCGLPTAYADFTFGTPVNLGPPVNSSANQSYASLSADGLSLYFCSHGELFVTKRATTSDDWETPLNLGPEMNSSELDWAPHISVDGLELYFVSRRPGGDNRGRDDLWVARRASLSDDWEVPVNVGPNVNTDNWEMAPCLSQDGLTLYFTSGQYNEYHKWVGTDLYVSHRETKEAPWGPSTYMGSVINDYSFDYDPAISPDGLLLVFSSDRGFPSDNSNDTEDAWYDLWMTSRRSIESEWESPVKLEAPINSDVGEWSPSISRDGTTLFYASQCSGGEGGTDLWQVPILPVVDFNGDDVVDVADIDIMLGCWGTDDSLCDIGPYPWGDGVVDVDDLIVLVEYMVEVRVSVDATDGVE